MPATDGYCSPRYRAQEENPPHRVYSGGPRGFAFDHDRRFPSEARRSCRGAFDSVAGQRASRRDAPGGSGPRYAGACGHTLDPRPNIGSGGEGPFAVRFQREAGFGNPRTERYPASTRCTGCRVRVQSRASRPRQPESSARQQFDGAEECSRRRRESLPAGQAAGGCGQTTLRSGTPIQCYLEEIHGRSRAVGH